jgi:protocatechuate 3,4-dioxygenase beta subunit
MSRTVGIVVAVLVAIALAVWLAGGPSKVLGALGLGDGGGGDATPGLSGSGSGGAGAGGDEAAEAGEPARLRGSVTFGRPREQRQGTGAVTGRVVRFADAQPLAAGTARITGTDHAGKEVSVESAIDSGGAFAFAAVPAGEGYVLRLEARGEPPFSMFDLEVRAGATKELGTIQVGRPGALEGRVEDEEGRPVANADVRVYSGYGSVMDVIGNFMEMFTSLDREPTALAKGRAASDGRFRVEGLSPGPVVVRATAAGKRAGTAEARMTPEGAVGGPVVVRLETGAVVGGVVVTEAGRPVPGATLAIMASNSMDVTGMLFGRTFVRTDDAGAFKAHVDPAEKKLSAIVVAEGYPRTMSQALVPGREDVRIVLKPGVEVEVTVLEAQTRAPIAGASVMIMASDHGKMTQAAMDPESDEEGAYLTATTDASGTAKVLCRPGLLEGVLVTAKGYLMGMAGNAMGGGGNEQAMAMFGRSDGPLEREVGPGKTNRVRMLLPRGVTVSGRVKDPQGNGIAGAEIGTMSFLKMMGGGVSAVAGPDGSYRVEGAAVIQEHAFLTAKAPGWIQPMSQADQTMGGVKVPAGATEVTHDFVLRPASTVRGRVVDADGKGVAGAEVTLESGGLSGMAGLLFGTKEAVTAADGAYVLFDLEEAKLPEKKDGGEPAAGEEPEIPFFGGSSGGPRVRATARGFVSATSEPFAIGAGANVTAPTIKLSRGATVRGRVTEPGGKPVAGATVEVGYESAGGAFFDEMFGGSRAGAATTLRTAADGTFAAETVPSGPVTFTASAPGWAPTRVGVTVAGEAAPEPFDLRLRPAREIRGRVTGPDGAAVAGASVSVAGGTGGGAEAYVAPVSASSGADGTFALKGLPPGSHAVSVRAKGFAPWTGPAEAGDSLDVRLSAQKAGAARKEEIQKEMGEIGMKFMATKDKAEREALQRRILELQQEQQALDGGEDADEDAMPGPVPVTPAMD